MTRQLGESKWRERYSELSHQKRLFGPAYLDAYAPLVAGAIDFHTLMNPEKRVVRILVIGGGKGHFSKRMLPAIKNNLAEAENGAIIKVVESDVMPVVRHAAKPRVRADLFDLPFAEKSFDLIIGESVLHVGKPDELESFARQAERILTPGGMVLHLQDAVPEGWSDRKLTFADELPKEMQREEMAARDAAHNKLADAIVEHAQTAGFSAMKHPQLGITPLTDGRLRWFERLLKRNPRANTVGFMFGSQVTMNDPAVKPGSKQLVFTGYATVAVKGARAQDVIDHAYNLFARKR